jgi:hypothetical protein
MTLLAVEISQEKNEQWLKRISITWVHCNGVKRGDVESYGTHTGPSGWLWRHRVTAVFLKSFNPLGEGGEP